MDKPADRTKSRWIKPLFFTILSLCVLAALTFSILTLTAKKTTDPVGELPTDAPAQNTDGQEEADGDAVNILLLGTDQVSGCTDVIIVARLTENNDASLVQIPRDTYTGEYGKINSYFPKAVARYTSMGVERKEARRLAGRDMAGFLSSALGITIDGSVLITLEDFRAIVDSVGGVDVELPKALDYDDDGQDLHIHLKAGKVHLDGKDAEGLVRCRSEYLTADYGRMDAQKIFLTALYKKVRTSLSLPSLFMLTLRTWQAVSTDLSLTQTISLARRAMKADFSTLGFASVKGRSVRVNGQSCQVIPEETLAAAALALGAVNTDALASGVFVDERADVQKAYYAKPVAAFSFSYAGEIDQNGLEIR